MIFIGNDCFRRRVFAVFGGDGSLVSWILQFITDLGLVVISTDTCCHPEDVDRANLALRELSQRLSQKTRPFSHRLVVSSMDRGVSLQFSTDELVQDFDNETKILDLHLEVVRVGHAGEDNTPMMIRFGHAAMKLEREPNPINSTQAGLSENFIRELGKLLKERGFKGVEKLF